MLNWKKKYFLYLLFCLFSSSLNLNSEPRLEERVFRRKKSLFKLYHRVLLFVFLFLLELTLLLFSLQLRRFEENLPLDKSSPLSLLIAFAKFLPALPFELVLCCHLAWISAATVDEVTSVRIFSSWDGFVLISRHSPEIDFDLGTNFLKIRFESKALNSELIVLRRLFSSKLVLLWDARLCSGDGGDWCWDELDSSSRDSLS